MQGSAMNQKKMVMLAMVAGSIAGGYMPTLLGFETFMLSIAGSTVGALVGIWLGYKLTR